MEGRSLKGRQSQKAEYSKIKSQIFIKSQKAEFHFDLSKISSKGTLSQLNSPIII